MAGARSARFFLPLSLFFWFSALGLSAFVIVTQIAHGTTLVDALRGWSWMFRIVTLALSLVLGWVVGRGLFADLLRGDVPVARSASAGVGVVVALLAAAIAVSLTGVFGWPYLAGASGLLFVVAAVLMWRGAGWKGILFGGLPGLIVGVVLAFVLANQATAPSAPQDFMEFDSATSLAVPPPAPPGVARDGGSDTESGDSRGSAKAGKTSRPGGKPD